MRTWNLRKHDVHGVDKPGLPRMPCEFVLSRRDGAGGVYSGVLSGDLRDNALHQHQQQGVLALPKRLLLPRWDAQGDLHCHMPRRQV